MINLPGCIVLPPGVDKIFQIRKIQRYDKSDKNISYLIIECFDSDKSCQLFPVISNYTAQCFGRNKSCQKLYFKQLISP